MSKFITENFSFSEFVCPCCGKVIINSELVFSLQELRDVIKKPIFVTSGYRCERYNRNIGGFVKSKHMEGLAADIKVSDMTPKELAKEAILYFSRIGIYPNHVHVGIALPELYWVVKEYGGKYNYFTKFKDALDFSNI